MQKILPHVLVFGLVSLTQACGETVNFKTEEKLAPAAVRPVDEIKGDDAIKNPGEEIPGEKSPAEEGSGESPDGESKPTSEGDGKIPATVSDEVGEDGIKLACHTDSVVAVTESLVFPEIPQGTTCKFGVGDNLSALNGQIRAYLKQSQTVTLPEGAALCGLSLEHQSAPMRYDDEMFFSVNERLLLATKDYTEYFGTKDGFHQFSWEQLRDKYYANFDMRSVYCAGGAEGLATCSVPETDTQGQIDLSFSDKMDAVLAKSLQKDQSLTFDWITIGDNDDSDCRHTEIKLNLKLRYVLPRQ